MQTYEYFNEVSIIQSVVSVTFKCNLGNRFDDVVPFWVLLSRQWRHPSSTFCNTFHRFHITSLFILVCNKNIDECDRDKTCFNFSQFTIHNAKELWCWIRYACEVRLEAFIINNEQASSCLLHSINPEYSHEFPSLCQEEAEEWEELKSLSKTKIRTHNIPLRFDANKRCLEINAECRAVVASAQQRAIFS